MISIDKIERNKYIYTEVTIYKQIIIIYNDYNILIYICALKIHYNLIMMSMHIEMNT